MSEPFTATLISDGKLDDAMVSELVHQFALDFASGDFLAFAWIDEGYAVDLDFVVNASFSAAERLEIAEVLRTSLLSIVMADGEPLPALDVVVQPAANREKRLLVADMDSTMITVECLDELADYAGIKAEIAAVTEAAMCGELDFAAALDARVALLAGLEEAAIDRCLAERVKVMPGAKALVRTMRARGAMTILVSGGFTRFAEPVAAMIGFDRVIANTLEVASGRLTGKVAKPIIGADAKLIALEQATEALGIDRAATLAVGDGANDLPMIQAAGLGVAYRAKPIVAAAAGARIEHNDLTALLYAQGIPRGAWEIG